MILPIRVEVYRKQLSATMAAPKSKLRGAFNNNAEVLKMGAQLGLPTLCWGVALSMAAFGAAPSPVADAAMRGDIVAVRALMARKADVNAPQPDGATALMWAAQTNDVDLVELLL